MKLSLSVKKCLLLLPVVLFIFSCNGVSQNKKQDTDTAIKTISLTRKEFLQKIFNYQSNDSLGGKYEGDKPAVINFYADWNKSCKLVATTLESLAKEYDSRIYVYRVDVEKEKELVTDLGITALPTVLFVPVEGEVTVSYGVMTNAALKKQIDSLLFKQR
jgi:thioredoxin-like negative regulator of GroEL